MLGAKRRKTMDMDTLSVVKSAREVSLDFAKVMPQEIAEWCGAVARSRNTSPDFVFLSAIPTTAALMGPMSSLEVRATYKEPFNIYSVILSPPGAGKSQAFNLTTTSPLSQLDDPAPEIVVGDHTKSGLARHLVDKNGVALLASDEMSTFLDHLCSKKKDGIEERTLLNKLYDWRSDMGSYRCEQGNMRIEVDAIRVCIAGFSQDEEFVQQYAKLCERKDGFVDRLLFAVPKPQLLLNREVDSWAEKLSRYPIKDFTDIYQQIWEAHMDTGALKYKLSAEAYKAYEVYSDELTRKLNWSFKNGSGEEVSSKDGRTVLRLAGVLHVLYNSIEHALHSVNFRQEDLVIPREISSETMKYAAALTDYFKAQRNVFSEAAKGNESCKSLNEDEIKGWILRHPGPFVSLRSVTRAIPCGQRPNADTIQEAMISLEKDDKVGVFTESSMRVKLFLKRKVEDVKEESSFIFQKYVTEDIYKQEFYKRDAKMTDWLFQRLLQLHPNSEELKQAFGI